MDSHVASITVATAHDERQIDWPLNLYQGRTTRDFKRINPLVLLSRKSMALIHAACQVGRGHAG